MKRTKIFPILLVGIFFVYLVMSSSAINEKQAVVADMTSLYIIQRMADGLNIYEDIAVLYGPVFYYVGAFLVENNLSFSDLKIVMLLVSLFSGILVYLISIKVFNDQRVGLTATGIYLFIPIHYGMAPVFHADSFAVFFVLLSLYLLLINKNILFLIAGLIASLAFFTKIPSISLIIAPLIFFAFNKNKNGLWYIIPLIFIILLGSAYFNSNNDESQHTQLMIDSLLKMTDHPFPELRDFFWIEGFAFLVFVIGLFFYIKNTTKKSVLPYYAILSILSFSAFLIPGVGIYEANYMEPFIAIFSAYVLFQIYDTKILHKFKKFEKHLAVILISLIFIQFIPFILPDRERIADWDGDGRSFIMNEIAEHHANLLSKYTNKGDLVVASPMAVYKTERILPLENPFPDLLKRKSEFGYNSAYSDIQEINSMLEKKEIKMLITFNSTQRNEQKFNNIQEMFFFPFNTNQTHELLNNNYQKFDDVFNYYLPKI